MQRGIAFLFLAMTAHVQLCDL